MAEMEFAPHQKSLTTIATIFINQEHRKKNQVFARIHSQAAHAAWIDGPALSASTPGPRSFGTFRPARHAKCVPDQTAPPRATPSPHVVS
ncbi:hypothetical protein [Ralstonia pseudosolanacearum]|uniref:hypothetical protein n=1 Tax=Ralstonia pseudosolanacearum TaxID=1310165 RepID=UPI001071BB56|nr:hypothetical protein [Ralstonia sp. RS642]QWQ11816.1 hypothetical protein KN198_16650 [Ralstonia solanacearum]UZF24777.1 hypothetical protein LGV80_17110 [Ralstonia sp. RS642]